MGMNKKSTGGFVSGIATGAMMGMAMGTMVAMNMDNSTKRKIKRSQKAVRSFTDDVYGNVKKWMD